MAVPIKPARTAPLSLSRLAGALEGLAGDEEISLREAREGVVLLSAASAP